MTSEERYLNQINEVAIDPQELLEVSDHVSMFYRNHPDVAPSVEVNVGLVIDCLLKRDDKKLQALMFRLEALAKLLGDDGLPGWTLPLSADGAMLMQKSVFAAAAIHPLVLHDHHAVFDRQPFLDRVLELTRATTHG
jgi:hypothetical protein